MNKLNQTTPDATTKNSANARRAAWIMLVTAALAAGVYLFLAFQTGAWQFFGAAGAAGLVVAASIFSLQLARQERPELAGQFLIYGFALGLLGFALLISGFGLLLGVVTAVAGLMITSQTLRSKQTITWAIISSVVLGVLIVALDLISLPFRRPAPEIEIFVPVVLVLILLIYGVFIWRQFNEFSLRVKLIITFVAAGILAVGAVDVAATIFIQQALIQEENNILQSAALHTVVNLDNFIETDLNTIQAEAQLPILAAYLALPANGVAVDEANATLRALSQRNDYITSYALLNNRGIDVLDTDVTLIGQNSINEDYFQQAVQTGQPYVSPVTFDAGRERWLHFSSPVRNAADEIIGVVRVRYQAEILQQIVAENSGLAGEESFGVLLDENNIRLADGEIPEMIGTTVTPLSPARLEQLQALNRLPPGPAEALTTHQTDFEAGLAQAETQPTFTAEIHQDDETLEQVAVSSLQTQPNWRVAFAQPRDVFLAPVKTQTQLIGLVSVLVAIGVAGLAFGVGQYLAGPIVRLTETANKVSQGDLTAKAPVESKDEIGQLAQVFNQMTARLRQLVGSLEEQVQERTEELALSMEVGQRAATIRELDELLPAITNLIRERFKLYYTHVYFVDDLAENLVIKAGTGEVGRQLLANKHTLKVGGDSIVGQVAATGQSIVVPNTEKSDTHKPNPLLPDTRSEAAVPLLVEGDVIGVLDMQDNQPETFTPQNLTVFEAMATQLAIAIESARQWTRAQEAQRRSQEAVQQLTHQSWANRLAKQEGKLGYAYDLATITPFEPTEQNGGVAVSVKIQNQSIGRLTVQPGPGQSWTEEEQGLLEAVAQQLAQKAENLRLFEVTQQRATREQMARQITDKIRASRDIETALETAARELSQALGVTRAVAELQAPQTGDNDDEAEPTSVQHS